MRLHLWFISLKFYFSITIFILLTSCNTNIGFLYEHTPSDSLPLSRFSMANFITTVDNSPLLIPEDSIVCYMSVRSWSSNDDNPLISVSAQVRRPGDTAYSDVGKVYIGGCQLDSSLTILDETNTIPASFYFFSADSSGYHSYNQDLPDLGTVARYSIEGNPAKGIDSFSTTMYTPRTLLATFVNAPFSTIDRNSPLQVSWKRDPYHPTGEVAITISCSRGATANIPLISNNIFWWNTYLEGNHSNGNNVNITIPVSVLHSFPPGSTLFVNVMRGCRKYIRFQNGWCSILAHSYTDATFILSQ